VEERNPSFVGVQEPDTSSRDRLDLVIIEIITRGWSRVEDVKIEYIEYERTDFLGWCTQEIPDETKYWSQTGSEYVLETLLLIARVSQTIGWCVISEAVSAEVVHAALPASTESSSDTVINILKHVDTHICAATVSPNDNIVVARRSARIWSCAGLKRRSKITRLILIAADVQ
jgi:hypothetical protein